VPRRLMTQRPALISTLAHGGALALLLLTGGFGPAPAPPQGPIIEARLVVAPLRRPAETPLEPSPREVSEAGVPAETEPAPLEPAESPAPAEAKESPPEHEPAPPPRAAPEAPDQRAEPATVVAAEPPKHEAETEPEPTAGPDGVSPALPAPPAVAEVDSPPREQVTENTPPPEPGMIALADRPFDAANERTLGRRLASWTGRFESGEPEPTMHWREDGQEYTAVLRQMPADDVMGMQRLAVEVTTERDGQRLQTELRMTRLAFSNFAQFVNSWDPRVGLLNDEIDGRFHSNSEIIIGRRGSVQPVFRGKVTLAARDYALSDDVGWINRKKLFPAGLETSVRRVALPSRDSVVDGFGLHEGRVRRLDTSADITFYADGTYGVRDVEDSTAEERHPIGEGPFYVIGSDDSELRVRGTVNGTVLVYTPDRIVIVDDLLYAADPREPGADDYLGLVAERTVEVAPPDVTGPGDLEIQASIYARRQFAVRAYRSRPSGTLHVFGSISAGTLTATEPRYATKIEFDERLTTMRAPGFPLSDRYELEAWSGEWHPVAGDSSE